MMRELAPWRSPFGLIGTFRRDMDELFNRFFGDWEKDKPQWSLVNEGYYPRIDSYVDGNTLHLKADLPGIDPKDVELTVEGQYLTLKGERKAHHEMKDSDYVRREVQYGSFTRTFTLPEGVKAEDLHASYHNGVLEITFPVPATFATKKVPIEVANEEPKQLAA